MLSLCEAHEIKHTAAMYTEQPQTRWQQKPAYVTRAQPMLLITPPHQDQEPEPGSSVGSDLIYYTKNQAVDRATRHPPRYSAKATCFNRNQGRRACGCYLRSTCCLDHLFQPTWLQHLPTAVPTSPSSCHLKRYSSQPSSLFQTNFVCLLPPARTSPETCSLRRNR